MKCKVVIPVNGVKRNRDGSIALKKRFKANAEVDGKFIRHGLLPENQVVLFEHLDFDKHLVFKTPFVLWCFVFREVE